MDNLLSLDNFLEDEFSFPFDDIFNPIDAPDIESLLNEIEENDMFHEKLFHNQINHFSKIKPTILFKNKKNKIGTSLLAKPPKKMKKDKNSLLARTDSSLNSFNSNTNLLMNNWHKFSNMFCQTMTTYIYQEHNYCFNPSTYPIVNNSAEKVVDLNNNSECKLNSEIVPFCDEVICDKKDVHEENIDETLNLVSSENTIDSLEVVHDVNDYFNKLFSTCNEKESKQKEFNTENSNISLVQETEEQIEPIEQIVVDKDLDCCLQENKQVDEKLNKIVEIDNNNKFESSNVLILNDINNYNINELETDCTCNEEEEDDIVINADIFIDEMFGDFGEYDLITKKASKNKTGHKNKNTRNHNNNKSPKLSNSISRRIRTISNSYSVRSNSACSCCSDDISEDDVKHENLLKTDNTNNNNNGEMRKKHLSSSLKQTKNKLNRKTSKTIKTDNTYIRKRNRFFLRNNSF